VGRFLGEVRVAEDPERDREQALHSRRNEAAKASRSPSCACRTSSVSMPPSRASRISAVRHHDAATLAKRSTPIGGTGYPQPARSPRSIRLSCV
jgi:hypothetical protein